MDNLDRVVSVDTRLWVLMLSGGLVVRSTEGCRLVPLILVRTVLTVTLPVGRALGMLLIGGIGRLVDSGLLRVDRVVSRLLNEFDIDGRWPPGTINT